GGARPPAGRVHGSGRIGGAGGGGRGRRSRRGRRSWRGRGTCRELRAYGWSVTEAGPAGEHEQGGSGGTNGRGTRTRVTLTEISSRAWEHPADRGALTALRQLRGFDYLLRKLAGLWNERALR